jgi:hypothetical protein
MLMITKAYIWCTISFVVRTTAVDDNTRSERSKSKMMISAFEKDVNDGLPFLKQPYKVSRRLQTIFETFEMASSDAYISDNYDENGNLVTRISSTVSGISIDVWNLIANFLWSNPSGLKKQKALHDVAIAENVLGAFPMLKDGVMATDILDRFVYDDNTKIIDTKDDCFSLSGLRDGKSAAIMDSLLGKLFSFQFISILAFIFIRNLKTKQSKKTYFRMDSEWDDIFRFTKGVIASGESVGTCYKESDADKLISNCLAIEVGPGHEYVDNVRTKIGTFDFSDMVSCH